MKILNFNRMIFVCAIVIGIVVSLSVAHPQKLTGNQLYGNGRCCIGRKNYMCPGYNGSGCLYVLDCDFGYSTTRNCCYDCGDEVCPISTCSATRFEDTCVLN